MADASADMTLLAITERATGWLSPARSPDAARWRAETGLTLALGALS
jgi:hypothetical protein